MSENEICGILDDCMHCLCLMVCYPFSYKKINNLDVWKNRKYLRQFCDQDKLENHAISIKDDGENISLPYGISDVTVDESSTIIIKELEASYYQNDSMMSSCCFINSNIGKFIDKVKEAKSKGYNVRYCCDGYRNVSAFEIDLKYDEKDFLTDKFGKDFKFVANEFDKDLSIQKMLRRVSHPEEMVISDESKVMRIFSNRTSNYYGILSDYEIKQLREYQSELSPVPILDIHFMDCPFCFLPPCCLFSCIYKMLYPKKTHPECVYRERARNNMRYSFPVRMPRDDRIISFLYTPIDCRLSKNDRALSKLSDIVTK